MIRVGNIKLSIEHTPADLRKKTAAILHVKEQDLLTLNIVKKSLDARKKPQLFFLYSVDVALKQEEKIVKHLPKDCSIPDDERYQVPEPGGLSLAEKPVIVGDGPAGLFCAYLFALCGIPAVLIERGQPVEQRVGAVEAFWKEKKLLPDSNVQFGEGGAGTFSDGKLNTLVKDKTGKNRFVLETFVKFGAPEEILYEAKPHIGTDRLRHVITNMRDYLTGHGIDIRFETKMTGLRMAHGAVTGIETQRGELIPTEHVVLAIGHSARDTFEKLKEQGVHMESKAFAVGLRVEHPREFINESQYGVRAHRALKAASYKLTAQAENGRGVYSFCMCPGGYVVNASSEEGRLAVNGMSYYDRNAENSNSAVIVTVTPDDFGGDDPLSGVAFQRRLEEKAFQIGRGAVPVETFGDFEKAVLEGGQPATGEPPQDSSQPAAGDPPQDSGQPAAGAASQGRVLSEESDAPQSAAPASLLGAVKPCTKGAYLFAPVHEILPEALNRALIDGMHRFGRKLRGFDDPACLLSGVESRTSSPVRIRRTDAGESVNVRGLFPCGEGAGYAGGIMSAAMDGLYIAEKIIRMEVERDDRDR